jgi:hypothetical protein
MQQSSWECNRCSQRDDIHYIKRHICNKFDDCKQLSNYRQLIFQYFGYIEFICEGKWLFLHRCRILTV